MTDEVRSRMRYPIAMAATFTARRGRSRRLSGAGQVLNISSRGVAFRTSTPLYAGEPIELVVEWPVSHEDGCPLGLRLSGVVVRSQANGLVAATVRGFEFCTRSRQPGAVVRMPPPLRGWPTRGEAV
jgi:hypothetical protein